MLAPTPPTERLKMCLSTFATEGVDHKLLYLDVSRAFFYAKAERPVFVKLLAEDVEPGDENTCGRLLMPMYGTRDAAVNWHHEYVAALERFGMRRGKASPCLFYTWAVAQSVLVRGDDFVAVGPRESIHKLKVHLQSEYQVKAQVMGPCVDEATELRILNRVVRYCPDKGCVEADPRHCELLVRALGLA